MIHWLPTVRISRPFQAPLTWSGLALLVALCVDPACSAADPPGNKLGIVAEKPASGRYVKTKLGYMIPYEAIIPGSNIKYHMEPIPGGQGTVGSPAGEKKRQANEGPLYQTVQQPYWLGKYELRWEEYKEYMALHDIFKSFETYKLRPLTDKHQADAITAPSNLYDTSFTFVNGENPKLPAVTMSQYAAKQYTKWLTGLTGRFYRLPSEAEWEYACRAGTTTAYHFGDDPAKLGEYAWYFDNSNETTHPIGLKKPNPWGLYDMHGNVGEWTLDELFDNGYQRLGGKTVAGLDSIGWPTKLYPRVVRGGSWDMDPENCRSAFRLGSHDDDWRGEDPNIPLSPWWFTSEPALGVGMRLLRPLQAPTQKDREKFWRADLKQVQEDVDFRIQEEGRGALGYVDPTLPMAIKELKDRKSKRKK